MSAPTTVSIQPIAAVAAAPLADLLLGSRRSGSVLGSSSGATWLEVDDRVLVLSGPGGARLPNSLMAATRFRPEASTVAHTPAAVTVGDGGIECTGQRFRVSRWWHPCPVLPRTRPSQIRELAHACADLVPALDDAGIGEALARRSRIELLRAGEGLLGKGPGLTPEGDDIIVGALASYRLLGRATGLAADGFLANVERSLVPTARRRTTRLSASLIGHALHGEVADALGLLLRAFTGRAELIPAVRALSALGHSSGPAMAFGAMRGAWAVSGRGT